MNGRKDIAKFVLVYLIGMILGPLMDGMHIHSGVLTYNDPEAVQSWWVPFLFGGATLGITFLLIIIEKLFGQPSFVTTRRSTFFSVILFMLMYAFSAYSRMPSWSIFLVIALAAVSLGVKYINNKPSLLLVILVTLIGPVVEITISSSGLFHYIAPDIWGIPLWLYPLYTCAAIAVGHLLKTIFNNRDFSRK